MEHLRAFCSTRSISCGCVCDWPLRREDVSLLYLRLACKREKYVSLLNVLLAYTWKCTCFGWVCGCICCGCVCGWPIQQNVYIMAVCVAVKYKGIYAMTVCAAGEANSAPVLHQWEAHVHGGGPRAHHRHAHHWLSPHLWQQAGCPYHQRTLWVSHRAEKTYHHRLSAKYMESLVRSVTPIRRKICGKVRV